MVRIGYQRINKYIAELKPKINKKRYEGLKEKMIENIIDKYNQLAILDAKTKAILDSHSDRIPTQYIYYSSYTCEIWLLVNKYSGIMLHKLIVITEDKWESKGLNKDIMERFRLMSKLERMVYNYYFYKIKKELLPKRLKRRY